MEFLPFIMIAVLALIGGFFVYLIGFRTRLSADTQAQLDALYAQADEAFIKTTLIWRSQEPKRGQLAAVVAWVDGYDPLDRVRQSPQRNFEDYAALDTRWRQAWAVAEHDSVYKAAQAAFEAQLEHLRAQGWTVEFAATFSAADRMVYLSQPRGNTILD